MSEKSGIDETEIFIIIHKIFTVQKIRYIISLNATQNRKANGHNDKN